MQSMDAMDFPFIALHGDDDTLCDPDGSRQLFKRSAVDPRPFTAIAHLFAHWYCALLACCLPVWCRLTVRKLRNRAVR